jgi:hypothetical protein
MPSNEALSPITLLDENPCLILAQPRDRNASRDQHQCGGKRFRPGLGVDAKWIRKAQGCGGWVGPGSADGNGEEAAMLLIGMSITGRMYQLVAGNTAQSPAILHYLVPGITASSPPHMTTQH